MDVSVELTVRIHRTGHRDPDQSYTQTVTRNVTDNPLYLRIATDQALDMVAEKARAALVAVNGDIATQQEATP